MIRLLLLLFPDPLSLGIVVFAWVQFMGQIDFREYPRGVMVKAQDCDIVVSEFEFQFRY